MTKATALPAIKLPGVAAIPFGASLALFVEGANLYSQIRIGRPIEVELDDGSKVQAPVTEIFVGPLINMIVDHGPYAAIVYGKAYSPLSLIQNITDSKEGSGALDVTSLYVVIKINVPQPPPTPVA